MEDHWRQVPRAPVPQPVDTGSFDTGYGGLRNWWRTVLSPRPAGRLVRSLEALAGGISAGMIVVGLGLVCAQLFAHRLAPGTGLAAATGPGWGRVTLQLIVGVAGELVRFSRRWSGPTVRGLLAAAVLLVATVALWIVWWQ